MMTWGKLQNELQSCHNNINTLNNKLTYEMTHCNSQALSQKELCDERVAAAKLEVQKKMEKLVPSQHVSPQENAAGGAVKEDRPVMTAADATVVSHALSLSEPKGNEQPELLTNEIIVGPDATVLSSHKDQLKVQPAPSAAAVKQDILPPPEGAVKTQDGEAETSKPLKNNLTEEKEVEVMGAHEGETQTEDPGMEGMLIGQGNADETAIGQKMDEPDEYDADEQVVGGADLEKQQQSKPAENIGVEEELADYNGDDENEGEFEADKQIELAQH
uniref:Golgi membrane protein 1 n=1 Tax=Anabas testudineus TaxID=64144 RepID=A0AAQ6IEX5_ANATE